MYKGEAANEVDCFNLTSISFEPSSEVEVRLGVRLGVRLQNHGTLWESGFQETGVRLSLFFMKRRVCRF